MDQRQTKSSDETMRDKIAANEKRSGYKTELEYIPDSLTHIQLSIEFIGFRKKLDQAFKAAISRIK